ncbi:MAG TPA: hypothetical protein VHA33_25740 [Candidatus Angelobacter sp.]|nr:hypothetical protein [Candidatus Angelobacter sp.]
MALVPFFVALCYLFDWRWLCSVTTTVLVEISKALGLPMHQIDRDMVELGGIPIRFVVACTMVDAFFGSIPLVWQTSVGLMRNGLKLLALFTGMSLLNIVRLEAGFLGLNVGIPWWLAHECVAGIVYFCLLVFIVQQQSSARRADIALTQFHIVENEMNSYCSINF